ncbi:MAG: 16S rRNA (adenine(1518)-N(6)/adenine(1519)-N(6))-dimethyltransferase RsmA [Acidobacteria bacterium]|nr:16S rRNA (adenine(1518)-N(6)/adenine(1519)-N(6))-dimethyltransferase RsmA [Acidobacteriota bacterium]
MKNKRFLGQHFLISTKIKEKILSIIKRYLPMCNSILEIGPGEGAITEFLAHLNKPLFAVEKDSRLIRQLKEKNQEITLFEEDARIFKIETIEEKFFPVMVVGNLPYYAGTEIILNLLSNPSKISSAHFTIQKEVAMKFSSKVSEEYYSKYSVWADAFYDTKIDFHIGKGAFSPPPKVVSSFLTFVPKKDFSLSEFDSLVFFDFVQRIFHYPRKTFLSNLQKLVLTFDHTYFNDIDKNLRPKDIEPKYYFLAYKNSKSFPNNRKTD